MPGLVGGGLARWDPGVRRRAAERVGCRFRWRPLCWRVGDRREWWLGRRGFVAATGLAAGMVAWILRLVVVAAAWVPAVRIQREDWRDTVVARLGVRVYRRCRTLVGPVVAE